MESNTFGIVFLIVGGLFCVVAAVVNWNWFMNHRKARFIVSILGRTGARIFYVVLGLFLLVFGVVMALGLVPGT